MIFSGRRFIEHQIWILLILICKVTALFWDLIIYTKFKVIFKVECVWTIDDIRILLIQILKSRIHKLSPSETPDGR